MRVFAILLITASLLSASMSGSKSSDPDYGALFRSLFSHMALTYMCRNELGGLSHYQAARFITIETASKLMDRKEVIISVDKMDAKFKADPRAKNPKVTSKYCLEQVNESLHNIDVQKAKSNL